VLLLNHIEKNCQITTARKIIPIFGVCQREKKVVLIKQRSLSNFFLLTSIAIASACTSCTLPGLKSYELEGVPVYASQKEIVKQGFTAVPSPFGSIPSVYFGYKRNRNPSQNETAKANLIVDIIEYKILKEDGGWNWKPYLIFSDDNFDGIADRLFLDSNLDGSLDKIYNIASKGVIINRITFESFEPWLMKKPIKMPGYSFDRI
jgi:hypothetical protein